MFAGTWDRESSKVGAGLELQMQPYEYDGLSFDSGPDCGPAKCLKRMHVRWDGYPELSPNRDSGSAYAGRRVNDTV